MSCVNFGSCSIDMGFEESSLLAVAGTAAAKLGEVNVLHVAVEVDEENVLLLLVAEFGCEEDDGSESVAVDGEGLLLVSLCTLVLVSISCRGGPGRNVSLSETLCFIVLGFVGRPCGMVSSRERGFAGRPPPPFPTKLLSFVAEVIAAAAYHIC